MQWSIEQTSCLDERRARRTAIAAGITVTGLLGVVARAKRAGLIAQAKPVLDESIRIARFWIGPNFIRKFSRNWERPDAELLARVIVADSVTSNMMKP